MYFLSRSESEEWQARSAEIVKGRLKPKDDLLPAHRSAAFHFHAGSLLAAKGQHDLAAEWYKSGATLDEPGLTMNSFFLGFMDRHQGKLEVPTTVFADPQPFVHFATVPEVSGFREAFIRHVVASMPLFTRPFRIVDIGCGAGAIVIALLKKLRAKGKVKEIGEILLIDRSPGMLKVARDAVSEEFPGVKLSLMEAAIENVASKVEGHWDVMLNSLSYHHLTLEQKRAGLERLREHADHFVYCELDAAHDTPQLHAPELSYSVYQSYGRLIDLTFAHDAPVELVLAAVDNLLMTEAVSLLIEPRGKRNDYHMLKSEWQDLLDDVLGPGFTRLCDSACHSDDYFSFFTLHYGR